jgi:hypothetical protein
LKSDLTLTNLDEYSILRLEKRTVTEYRTVIVAGAEKTKNTKEKQRHCKYRRIGEKHPLVSLSLCP